MPPLFEFRQGNTLCHGLDPRCKFFLICLTGAGVVHAGWAACMLGLAGLTVLLFRGGTGPLNLIRGLKLFILFLCLIILTRAMAVSEPPLLSIFGHKISLEGLAQGGLTALRFLLVMVMGVLFSTTTRPSDLKAAVQWFLGPIPLVPEKRVAVIISLAFRFIPLIQGQARDCKLAIQARCGDRVKHPLKRILVPALALTGKTVRRADTVAMAMAARCYTDTRTDPEFSPSGKEPLVLSVGTAFFLICIFV